LYRVVPYKSNTVVAEPYHIVDADMIPGINTADKELDKTDSILYIRKRLKRVGPGRDIRCQVLAPIPNMPADR
jgi:hypothetical protein